MSNDYTSVLIGKVENKWIEAFENQFLLKSQNIRLNVAIEGMGEIDIYSHFYVAVIICSFIFAINQNMKSLCVVVIYLSDGGNDKFNFYFIGDEEHCMFVHDSKIWNVLILLSLSCIYS